MCMGWFAQIMAHEVPVASSLANEHGEPTAKSQMNQRASSIIHAYAFASGKREWPPSGMLVIVILYLNIVQI